MQLLELNVRGSGFTLRKIEGITEDEHMHFRKLVMYMKLLLGEETEVPKEIVFSVVSKKDEFGQEHKFFEEDIKKMEQWLENNEYAEIKNGKYVFTEKTNKIFEEWARQNNELTKNGFHECPCHGC